MGRAGEGQGLMGMVLILVLGWGLLYLPALGTRELQGEEARRVLPGRTMLQTGDWVVPRSAGKIYNRKPPLINWATAWAIKLTGRMDEWSVRLPSVLGMLALALTVLLAGRVWLGNEGAFLAACVCLTNIGFLEKGRLAEIEGIYMALFGMGTLPVMLGISLTGRALPVAWRFRLQQLVPLSVGLVGALLILRGLALGIPYLSPNLAAGTCAHCH